MDVISGIDLEVAPGEFITIAHRPETIAAASRVLVRAGNRLTATPDPAVAAAQ